MGYKQALGIIMLVKDYSNERLERACSRGLCTTKRGFHIIENILKNGMDKEVCDDANVLQNINNPNIRGGSYYN